jgi:hypothetical protein
VNTVPVRALRACACADSNVAAPRRMSDRGAACNP